MPRRREHRELATYARLREEGRQLTPPSQTIRPVKLYHRQVYEYAYHRPKIVLLTQSKEHLRYTAGLASFLEPMPKACPHNLFTDSVRRASQTAPDFLDRPRIIAHEKQPASRRSSFPVWGTIIGATGSSNGPCLPIIP